TLGLQRNTNVLRPSDQLNISPPGPVVSPPRPILPHPVRCHLLPATVPPPAAPRRRLRPPIGRALSLHPTGLHPKSDLVRRCLPHSGRFHLYGEFFRSESTRAVKLVSRSGEKLSSFLTNELGCLPRFSWIPNSGFVTRQQSRGVMVLTGGLAGKINDVVVTVEAYAGVTKSSATSHFFPSHYCFFIHYFFIYRRCNCPLAIS
ncbi:hypothetical protein EJB05_08932, partial [Eragrostis curvula]